jgi:NDP-sugar pyrophosphorylase family protein
MILAAGLGTRMRPLTDDLAKPALPVLDEPLVLGLVRSLTDQGIERIVINTHAHADTVRDALRTSPTEIVFSHETVLRGSGGGIQAARSWLDTGEPFVVLNGDMRIDLDLSPLIRAHERARGPATVLLRDDPRKALYGTLGYDDRERVCRITDLVEASPETGSGLFAGVHLFEPAIFDRMPAATTFDIVRDVYVDMIRDGKPIGAALHPPRARWSPIGTPQELLDENLSVLRESLGKGEDDEAIHVGRGARVDGDLVGPVWVGPDVIVGTEAHVGPEVILGRGSRIGSDARLERTVVLPGASISRDARVQDAIVTPGGTWTRG